MSVLYDGQLILPLETGGEVSGNHSRGQTARHNDTSGMAEHQASHKLVRKVLQFEECPLSVSISRVGGFLESSGMPPLHTHTLEEFLENNDLSFQFWHVLRVPLAWLSLTWRYVEDRVWGNVVWDTEGHRHRAANEWSHPVRTVTAPLLS